VRCPLCKDPAATSRVVDSREAGGGFVIRRRRECLGCQRRFTTYERLEETPLLVVKADERRQPFDRQKVVASLTACCLKRSVPAERIEALADEVEREVREVHEREVSSTFIREAILSRLRALDPVAYVRYASVYREFLGLTNELESDLREAFLRPSEPKGDA
jgi:transcriptional repressor NrdR